MPANDNVIHQFSTLLHQTASLWRTVLDTRLKPLGFSQASWRTLIALHRHPGGCNQTELAARLGIEGPTLVRLLDRMEAQGWVRRQPDPRDRRSKHVEITDASRKQIVAMEKEIDALRLELLADVPKERLAATVELLSEISLKAEKMVRGKG